VILSLIDYPGDASRKPAAGVLSIEGRNLVMWGRKSKPAPASESEPASPLKQAMYQARVEAAERTSVVVDLRDAEVARLELLNEALDRLFADVPPGIDLFDRGLSRGDTPRLWIDPVAHVAMGRDKRIYRFLLDSRFGRRVLAESHEIADIVKAVTDYVARRLVERERALDTDSDFMTRVNGPDAARVRRRRRRRGLTALLIGFVLGVVALLLAIALIASRY
jgi:Protein of unknown function (DUF3040)